MVVVLFPLSDEEPALGPAALERLAGLGVSNVALLRDGSTAGLVLEGWAFDPGRAAEAALLVGACDGMRTLRPLVQMAVSPDRSHRHGSRAHNEMEDGHDEAHD